MNLPGSAPSQLRRGLAAVAGSRRLLVICDYDGTLAPIVDDPGQAWPRPESVDAVRQLSALPGVTVAVISGRARDELAALSGLGDEVVLVGSHGAEIGPGFAERLVPAARALLGSVRTELERLAEGAAGVVLEEKPASIAVHVRRAGPAVAERVLSAVAAGPARRDGVFVTEGKAVVELSVVAADKGAALDRLRSRLDADAVVVIGDDATDERAFARLDGPDVGIKVGPGASAARYRVDSPAEVTAVLALLVEARGGP